ncbi:MAG: cytochrome c3 family protein [Gemmatimonadetes bacterium]|nr:cytochrome c3 family protein [Gemmatimonadota bacterium]MYH53795.1 cytochrome c3 family protein [Gemmatimonadota bacterium]MYK67171.1 cytochrome c3 family protein [Gemmatimonadota bacterium]
MKRLWLATLVGALTVLLAVVLIGFRQAPDADAAPQTADADGQFQPIQFPHDTHAGQFTIPCQYCHFSAERSVDAGIPPMATCIGCHQEGIVDGRTDEAQAEIARVREYYASDTPIPWKRIYKVSDHVKFPHMRHVAAGVTCQTCHGQVQEMGVLEDMAPEAGDLRMGWCVSCHIERGASRDCTVCHY